MGALLVLVAAALWSTGGVGVKVANAEPLVVAGLRSVFALFFMTIVLVVTMRRRGDSARVVFDLLKRPLVWAAAASYALMVVYRCRLRAGETARAVEVADVRWVPAAELPDHDILPADRPLVERLVAEGPPLFDPMRKPPIQSR
jgi:hypothetical protein